MTPATIITTTGTAVIAPKARRQNPAVSGTAPKFFRHTTLRSPGTCRHLSDRVGGGRRPAADRGHVADRLGIDGARHRDQGDREAAQRKGDGAASRRLKFIKYGKFSRVTRHVGIPNSWGISPEARGVSQLWKFGWIARTRLPARPGFFEPRPIVTELNVRPGVDTFACRRCRVTQPSRISLPRHGSRAQPDPDVSCRSVSQCADERPRRAVFAHVALFLHYRGTANGEPGLTVGAMKDLCVDVKLCSRGRCEVMVALMRAAGFFVAAPGPDRRRRPLAPAEKLFALHRERWGSHFAAMRHVLPEVSFGDQLLPILPSGRYSSWRSPKNISPGCDCSITPQTLGPLQNVTPA